MVYIIASVFLFGLLHPGSKVFLDSGLGVFGFSLLFAILRTSAQIPVFALYQKKVSLNKETIKLVIIMSIAGACLQITEFAGIALGLKVSEVAFLVYAHPVWGIAFLKLIEKATISKKTYIATLLGVLGIFSIFSGSIAEMNLSWVLLLPLSASLFLAFWIYLSGKCKDAGMDNISLSFYYDLFTLGFLFLSTFIFGPTQIYQNLGSWWSESGLLVEFALYAVIIGWLPNILFFTGVKTVGSYVAGLALLGEPVIATGVAVVVWGEKMGVAFVVGSILILVANKMLSSKKS